MPVAMPTSLGQPVRVACHNGRNYLTVTHKDIEPRNHPFGQYRNKSDLKSPPYLAERRERPPQTGKLPAFG